MVQRRVPSGVSSGGQFAAEVRPEGSARLDHRTDETYNRDGSWFFPPRPRSARQSAAFWEACQVPDAVLLQFTREYTRNYELRLVQFVDAGLKEWEARWRQANPEPATNLLNMNRAALREAHRNAYVIAREDERTALATEYSDSRPGVIETYDARTLARAAQMYHYCPSPEYDPEEHALAMSHVVDLYDEELTVEEVERVYGLSEIHYSLEKVYRDDAVEKQMLGAIGKVTNALDDFNQNYLAVKNMEMDGAVDRMR